MNPNIVTTTQPSYAEFLSRVIISISIGAAGKRSKFAFHASQFPVMQHFGTEHCKMSHVLLNIFLLFRSNTKSEVSHLIINIYSKGIP